MIELNVALYAIGRIEVVTPNEQLISFIYRMKQFIIFSAGVHLAVEYATA